MRLLQTKRHGNTTWKECISPLCILGTNDSKRGYLLDSSGKLLKHLAHLSEAMLKHEAHLSKAM
jgi:hypothetical protein